VDFRIFAGNEVDILADVSLDFSDEIMGQLDFVVASIHQGFTNDEATQTKRMIKAISNKYVTMLGHVTGRLLLSREPYKVDMNALIEAAAANQTMIELNCTPTRMELDWRWWKSAKEKGVMCSINPDAHSIEELEQVIVGIGAARKGWLTKEDVLNTRSTSEVEKLLGRKRK
jgi:DNA polymerase (family 10)